MLVKSSNFEGQKICNSKIGVETQIEMLLDGFTNDIIKVLSSKQTPPMKK